MDHYLSFFNVPFLSPATVRRYPDGKDKVKALYIRIVSPFPEMERFLQDTIKRWEVNLILKYCIWGITFCFQTFTFRWFVTSLRDCAVKGLWSVSVRILPVWCYSSSLFGDVSPLDMTWSCSLWRAVFSRRWTRCRRGSRSWKPSLWGPGRVTPTHTHSHPCVPLTPAGQTTWESTLY